MPGRSTSRRRIALLAAPLVLLLGSAIPRLLIPAGDLHADPMARATAQDALESARQLNDNPLGRLLVPGMRVTRVWREPGHCRDPHPPGPQADYRAEVRSYAWFGIPGPRIEAQCGGWYVRVRS